MCAGIASVALHACVCRRISEMLSGFKSIYMYKVPLSSPRPSRKGNLLFQCEGSKQDAKTYRSSQWANCTSTQPQPNAKKHDAL